MRTAWTVLLALWLTSPVWALHFSDVVRMTEDGVSEDAIIAQLQADGTRLVVTSDRRVWLRRRGVSERVIEALAATRRNADAPAAAAPTTAPPSGDVPPPIPAAERPRGGNLLPSVMPSMVEPYSEFSSTRQPLFSPGYPLLYAPYSLSNLPPVTFHLGKNPPQFIQGAPGDYRLWTPPANWCPYGPAPPHPPRPTAGDRPRG